jgi:hypothetical protein
MAPNEVVCHDWSSSDARIKENIADANAHQILATYAQLRPVSYRMLPEFEHLRYNKATEDPDVGFLAQELGAVEPCFVFEHAHPCGEGTNSQFGYNLTFVTIKGAMATACLFQVFEDRAKGLQEDADALEARACALV